MLCGSCDVQSMYCLNPLVRFARERDTEMPVIPPVSAFGESVHSYSYQLLHLPLLMRRQLFCNWVMARRQYLARLAVKSIRI